MQYCIFGCPNDNEIFIRKKRNKSGSISIQLISKSKDRYKVVKTIGCATQQHDIEKYEQLAKQELKNLKTVEYLYRYQGVQLEINSIYRFSDKLSSKLKDKVEQIVFNHTKSILGGSIGVVFYDMTTLYFEASDEDDLRKTGFSKDGKHQHPQIFLGLLVALGGYVIGYDI